MISKVIAKAQAYQERINAMSGRKKTLCLIGIWFLMPVEFSILITAYNLYKRYKQAKQALELQRLVRMEIKKLSSMKLTPMGEELLDSFKRLDELSITGEAKKWIVKK